MDSEVPITLEEIQTWWEIPSIVHFCDVFSPVFNDLCRINIDEFEQAIEKNSFMLTNMVIRFIKICDWYNPNTDEWWNFMKKPFNNMRQDLNIEYSLDSVKCFDELTRKQKVETLYVLCHIILNTKKNQLKLCRKPEIFQSLNVKPLGYDLNKSVYWYFGNTRLYREEFPNILDFSSTDSLVLQKTMQLNTSNVSNSNTSIKSEPYPSGILGSGKWNLICNDDESWHSLAEITEHTKNKSIKYLHNSISNIIEKLPQLKRGKPRRYVFLKSLVPESLLTNTYTRTLRSGRSANTSQSISTSFLESNDIEKKECIQHVDKKLRRSVRNSLKSSKLERIENNDNVSGENKRISSSYLHNDNNNQQLQNLSSSYIPMNTEDNGESNVQITKKLKLNNVNTLQSHNKNSNFYKNLDLVKIRQDCLQRETIVYIKRWDQENVQKLGTI